MRKPFLTVSRPILTLDRRNLSFLIEGNQLVAGLPLLTMNTQLLAHRRARTNSAGEGGGHSSPLFEIGDQPYLELLKRANSHWPSKETILLFLWVPDAQIMARAADSWQRFVKK